MSLHTIGIVYRKELLDSLRDRRTVISMIVIPVIAMPLLTVGLGYLSASFLERARQETSKIMVLGGEDSPNVLAALRQAPKVEIVPASPNYVDLITDKQLRAAVEIPPGFEASLNGNETPTVTIDYYEEETRSGIAVERLSQFFGGLRNATVRGRLVARNLPPSLAQPFDVMPKNAVSPEKVFGNTFGALIPYIVILLCMTGAMYPAMDLTAGEKERGTMETILCSPVSRTDLVLGKFLMVLTASLSTAALAVISMGVSLIFAVKSKGVFTNDAGQRMSLVIHPQSILAVFAMILPIAMLMSLVMLAISLFAKSFREAQSYLSPLTIVVIFPAIMSMLPGVELNARLALVPILNTSLVSKEILSGTYHWNYILLIFASTCVYAALALVAAVHLFNREDVLFRA
jgi:sodium transport system permease protein